MGEKQCITIYTKAGTLRFENVTNLVEDKDGYILSFDYVSASREVPGHATFFLTDIFGYSFGPQ